MLGMWRPDPLPPCLVDVERRGPLPPCLIYVERRGLEGP